MPILGPTDSASTDLINLFKGFRNSVLTDGDVNISYKQIPSVLDNLDIWFELRNAADLKNFALIGRNTVFTVILLLWFLTREKNLVILGQQGVKNQPLDARDYILPGICPVVVQKTVSKGYCSLLDPTTYVSMHNHSADSPTSDPKTEKAHLYFMTSGSMDKPKLIKFSRDNFFLNAMNCLQRYQLSPQDRILVPVPVIHSYGMGSALLPALFAGSSIQLIPEATILSYFTSERTFQPTITYLTPSFGHMISRAVQKKRSYRRVIVSGECLSKNIFDLIEDNLGFVINQYGSTEMGAVASSLPGDSYESRAQGILTPFPDVSIAFNHETPLSAQTSSSDCYGILIKRKYGFNGYCNDEQNGTNGHSPEVWFKTGDCGIPTSEGTFIVSGRTDNSVKRNGILVSCSSLERILGKDIGDLSDIVILPGSRMTKYGPEIVLFGELKTDDKGDKEKIRARCFEVLPRYAIPDRIILVDSIPTLPGGKTDRMKLEKMV